MPYRIAWLELSGRIAGSFCGTIEVLMNLGGCFEYRILISLAPWEMGDGAKWKMELDGIRGDQVFGWIDSWRCYWLRRRIERERSGSAIAAV